MTLRYRANYFRLTVLFFVIETMIALYIDDRFIRPYFGDFLVVILVYCFVMAFIDAPVLPTAICVLAFAFIIEILQSVNFVQTLGMQDSKVANTVMGNSFAWLDCLMYIGGVAAILIIEKKQSGFRN